MLSSSTFVPRPLRMQLNLAVNQSLPTRGRTKTAANKACLLHDLHDRVIPYKQGWEWQKQILQRVIDRDLEHNASGAVLILQHAPVYTLGAGSTVQNVLFDLDRPPAPLYRTERGGEVTYHGPGQLVLYPILDLQQHRPDLHWYMRSLEEVVIRALHNVSGLQGQRLEGLTGVWIGGAKVAAIGVRAKKWVTYHGLALNVSTDLAPFSNIVPCGINDKRVTSVKAVLDNEAQHEGQLVNASDGELLREYGYALLESFTEVFGLDLKSCDTRTLLRMDGVD